MTQGHQDEHKDWPDDDFRRIGRSVDGKTKAPLWRCAFNEFYNPAGLDNQKMDLMC